MAVTDAFGRPISYLRLSVTDRCDLRCFYCLPRDYRGFRPPASWLTPSELAQAVAAFAELGVRHVRLTGGEPLVRSDLATIARHLSALPGIEELSLSTNAARLESQAAALRAAGICRINASLDSLDPATFARITGGGDLNAVLRGLEAARQAAMEPIKINMVMMRGINDHEAETMVEFCLERGFTLRFIETMPIGSGGREALNHYLDLEEIRQRLDRRFGLHPAAMRGSGPARYYQVGDSSLVVGFITPLSQHFCASCNRVRMAVDGRLFLCLGEEADLDLNPLLRGGADQQQLVAAIHAALQRKPERHDFHQAPERIIRPMSALGG